MNPELPIRAVVVERFDLGFILKHPNGRLGQLRVPEMSPKMVALDRSSAPNAGLGVEVEVYIVKEWQETYLFSELSGEERADRRAREQMAIEARSHAQIGQALTVTVIQKGDWGCLCREVDGLLEGFLLIGAMLERHGWSEVVPSSSTIEQLEIGSRIEVAVARKECSPRGGYTVYFSSIDHA